MKKIYISGAISNVRNWRERFEEAERFLQNGGGSLIAENDEFEIVSPLHLADDLDEELNEPTYRDYLKNDIAHLVDCDAAFFLYGWRESTGSYCEHAVAEALGLRRVYQQYLYESIGRPLVKQFIKEDESKS